MKYIQRPHHLANHLGLGLT